MVKKKVIIYSYYSPEELTGIGKYNGEMIEWLLKRDVEVISFSNTPFYPLWEKYESFRNSFYSRKKTLGLIDIRSWVFIPSKPSSIKKIVSEFSFFLSSSLAMILNLNSIRKSDAFIVICPPFFLGFFPLFICKIFKVPILQHIQDLQVDAARELKLLPVSLCSILEFFERIILQSSDSITTISKGMIEKLKLKGLNKQIGLIPNWSDLENIKPGESNKWLHQYLGLDRNKLLIVYSGNIGEKQGLELIIEAASQLESNDQLHFVILGEGLFKERLKHLIHKMNLTNITLSGLVSKENLNSVLNDSFIQLVIQKSSAADSFLPSKLTNILAAGCSSIVTANPGTSLYEILDKGKSSLIIEPESSDKLVGGINYLLNNEIERRRIKREARKWSEENLSISSCLSPLLSLINNH